MEVSVQKTKPRRFWFVGGGYRGENLASMGREKIKQAEKPKKKS